MVGGEFLLFRSLCVFLRYLTAALFPKCPIRFLVCRPMFDHGTLFPHLILLRCTKKCCRVSSPLSARVEEKEKPIVSRAFAYRFQRVPRSASSRHQPATHTRTHKERTGNRITSTLYINTVYCHCFKWSNKKRHNWGSSFRWRLSHSHHLSSFPWDFCLLQSHIYRRL